MDILFIYAITWMILAVRIMAIYHFGTVTLKAKFCLDYHRLSLGEWFKIAEILLTVIVVVEVDK